MDVKIEDPSSDLVWDEGAALVLLRHPPVPDEGGLAVPPHLYSTAQYSTGQYTVQSPAPCTAAGPRAAPRDHHARRGGRRGPRERPYTCTGSVPPFWNREGDIRNENIFYCISQKYFVQQPKIFCISQVLLQAFIIGSTQLSRQSSSL